jgi:hypothetical protein
MPDDFDPVFEQKLADLSDVDWQALTERVRPPTSAAQLREIAGKVISGDKLDAFVKVADPKAFASENGDIDPSKVAQSIGGLFGIVPETGPSHQNFGQSYPPPPIPGPGDSGRTEATKRFGASEDQPKPTRGRAGYDEAARRFPKTGER